MGRPKKTVDSANNQTTADTQKEVSQTFVDRMKEIQKDIETLEDIKKTTDKSFLYQAIIYLKTNAYRMEKKGWKKNYVLEPLKLPIVCNLIFTTETEAESYLPIFLDEVSKDIFGGHPLYTKVKDDIIEINQEMIEVVITPLTLVQAFEK